ncbi:MAG: helix-turn-helix domain-containing protein, partial [Oscillospiraceae bacterium]|nr:helix-turn-helix domain-containing protein [Oscillospiraceae bacterium]
HYNTVGHRLRRIEEMTHMSLDLPDDRLQLELALYLYKFRTSAAGQKREG